MTLATEAQLQRAMRALNGIPSLSNADRALIYTAMDAPHGTQKAAWMDVKYLDLSHGESQKPFTFEEAVRWESWPTAEQMIAGLQFASGVLT